MHLRSSGHTRATSEVLEETVGNHPSDEIPLGELIWVLQERGFGLLMIMLVLPCCIPVPVPPGVPTLFAVPLVFLAVQMILGRPTPWLPQWLKRKSVRRVTLAAMVARLSPQLRIAEKFLRPRLEFFLAPAGERLIGFFWLLCALSTAVPIPAINFVPGMGILLVSLGLLNRDGLFILIGMIIGLLGCGFTVALPILGFNAIKTLLAPTATIDIPEGF